MLTRAESLAYLPLCPPHSYSLPDIDVDEWRANTTYHNISSTSNSVTWFWRAVRSFDQTERAKLLQFCTGSSRVP